MKQVLKKTILNLVPPFQRIYLDRQRLQHQLDKLTATSLKHQIALSFIRGNGIEIGAFDQPFSLLDEVHVKYLDKFSQKELLQMYPESSPVEVGIIDDGETLATLSDSSQDFVIASHFLEHCQNPIGTVRNFLRVVRPQGYILLVIPDKNFTFDMIRERTTFQHLLDDYYKGPEHSHRNHCEEWVEKIDRITSRKEKEEKVNALIDSKWPIHFHVWTAEDIVELFYEMKKLPGFHFDIEVMATDQRFESTVLLKSKI